MYLANMFYWSVINCQVRLQTRMKAVLSRTLSITLPVSQGQVKIMRVTQTTQRSTRRNDVAPNQQFLIRNVPVRSHRKMGEGIVRSDAASVRAVFLPSVASVIHAGLSRILSCKTLVASVL